MIVPQLLRSGHERFTHPSTRRKFYRATLRSGNGQFFSRRTFKRAEEAEEYAIRWAERLKRMRGAEVQA